MADQKTVKAQAWLRTMERMELQGRQPGKVNGPIGYVGEALAREIAVRAKQGRCEASPGDLAKAVGYSKTAVDQAIGRLREAGLLAYAPGARGRKGVFRMTLPAEPGNDGPDDRRRPLGST